MSGGIVAPSASIIENALGFIPSSGFKLGCFPNYSLVDSLSAFFANYSNTEYSSDQYINSPFNFTALSLTVSISVNTLNSGSTVIKSRVNGSDGNQIVTIPFGVTGISNDSTNHDSLITDSGYNYKVTNTGTSGACTIYSISSKGLGTS